MPFQITRFKEFLVRPALPKELERLNELAYNLLWSWDGSIRKLFRRLDPVVWQQSGHNPVLMLNRLPQAALERAAADPRDVFLYRRACERLDAYLEQPIPGPEKLIAYFSMEYGLNECIPIYSGGLGILSGDHLKAASDSDVPLVAVGLLYQKGYHQQYLNPDGWQQERYAVNDFYTLPVTPALGLDGRELLIAVQLPDGEVFVKVWRMQVGRVQLFLLDTNIAQNARPEHREITDQLYGGDVHTRIRQEIVLGIGGLRALKAVRLTPTAFHMNEGHSAFLALERIRLLMQEHSLSFEEALEASRSNNIFTTHTSVPAGIDLFSPDLMYEYFQDYCREVGIPFETLLALGRVRAEDPYEPFSMAVAAFRTSSGRNAVSRLHQSVSQEMWQDLWPQLPVWEIPITCITNGVHLLTWLNGDLALLYDQYLQPDWRERYNEPATWDLVREIPSTELWEAHKRRKRRLLTFVRERATAAAVARKASAGETRRLGEVLEPEALTIGFARRFATYKRATLLFRDIKRLKKILTRPGMPVQIVIAGKAHPKDHPGKSLIREIVQLSRDPEISRHLVFLEDYGIEVGREMVQGVDLWLNNPRRGEEACGTSGMKAGMNGVLNLSILDGWFDEAYEVSGGWAIGDPEPYSEDQDEIHASAIYSLLENEVVPLYYGGRDEGVPEEWVRRMRQSLVNLSPRFNCVRMLDEYRSQLYEPAHTAYQAIRRDGFRGVRERARWKAEVQGAWDRVSFLEVGPDLDGALLSGNPVALRAVVDLAGLRPGDVRVEAVVGHVGSSGCLEHTEVLTLVPAAESGSAVVFTKEFVPSQTGRLGFSLRISPNHFDDPLTRPCNALLKWS
ncbi:MAG: alpha-glucan family phosphorylase [Acidobacteria bacterium]|nr:alpha-glucan family phosphorylase [Acidobacteriota bacterium]